MGLPTGPSRDVPPLPEPAGWSPAEALVAVIADQPRPWFVAFSGGRDSSLVLAAAVEAARRGGWEAPVPVAMRFAAGARTAEDDWQQLVCGHLGIAGPEVVALGDELDLLGPLATGMLRRHGLAWPPLAHMVIPVARRAAGGTLLTGHGGDELLGSWRWAAAAELRAGRTGTGGLRGRLRVAHARAPAGVRTAVALVRGPGMGWPWLRPGARLRAWARLAAHVAAEPTRWDERVAWMWSTRLEQAALAGLARAGAEAGTCIVAPLADPRFVAALAAAGGRWGWGDRTAATAVVAAGRLPGAVVARPTKAEFTAAVWGPAARRFAEGWDGAGVDTRLVDPGVLGGLWRAGNPPSTTFTLLHAVWLATR